MKNVDIKADIVRLLSDHEFLSGEQLGEALGMSRAAVSKHIKGLQSAGLDIFSLQGKGYKLANSLDILDANKIKRDLKEPDLGIEVHTIVSSTNDLIKDNITEKPNGYVCLAEAQTHGRGRLGRVWHSPFGANLYLSMVWHFSGGFQMMSGLSLAIGVAICESLQTLGVCNAKVKWPNDILIDGKKLAGILIETEGYSDGSCSAIIGCGINFKMPDDATQIDQPWTDIIRNSEELPCRNKVLAETINTMRDSLSVFQVEGFSAFRAKWEHYHAFNGEVVSLISGSKTISGTALGVDNSGAFALSIANEFGEEETHYFHGGEVSVRKL